MPVYSIMLPDSTILKRVAGLKSVLIVGCKGCINDSLAFDTGHPAGKVVVDKDMVEDAYLPTRIDEELKRLKKLLENNGVSAETEVMDLLCEISFKTEPMISKLAKRCAEVNAILSVSCAVGTLALKKQLAKACKVASATKTLGVFQPTKFLDESNKFVYVDRNHSKIIRFKMQ
jgi:hypothetical protein